MLHATILPSLYFSSNHQLFAPTLRYHCFLAHVHVNEIRTESDVFGKIKALTGKFKRILLSKTRKIEYWLKKQAVFYIFFE